MKTFRINKYLEVVCENQNTRYGFRHLATLLLNGIERETTKSCYYNRTWESYEFESVLKKLLENTKILSKSEKKQFEKCIKNGGESATDDLKAVSAVMALGDIFGKDQKQQNDWKARMLKAGLENKGLIIPEDWDSLSENDKQTRLNGVIEILGN